MLTKAQIAAEVGVGSQADGGLGPKRPVSLSSTGSSSSSRDSHLSFGSSLTLVSSPSSSLAPGDSGCLWSEREAAFGDREPELGKTEALTATPAVGRCQLGLQEDVLPRQGKGHSLTSTEIAAPVGPRAGHNEQQLPEAASQVRESDIMELEEEEEDTSCHRSSSGSNDQETGHPGSEGTRARVALAVDGCSLSPLERVLLEMLQTERAYVRDLSSIVQDYLGCMEATPGLPLSSQDLGTLFGNIRSIYTLNRDLLQDLERCGLDPVAAARSFISKSEAFQIYTEYCMNYPNAVRVLAECMCSPELGAVLAARQAALCHSLPLGSYLLKPVQRILKYHLLLHEVSRHCEDGAWERAPIQEALHTMTGVAQHINNVKRRHEQASRVQEIERLLSSWHGPELGRYGELVLEGVFRVARVRNQRTFFLFTNILLFTRRRDDVYVYKGHILCAHLMLVENIPKEPLSFTVGHFKNPKTRRTLQAHSLEEKRLWVHELKRLILENYPSDIPLKAKQAILDMDSSYSAAGSPAPHLGPDDSKKESWYTRRGRRKSEPGDRKLKPLESLASFRKRSGSVDGGLLRDTEASAPALREGSTETLDGAASAERHPLSNSDVAQRDPREGQAHEKARPRGQRDGPAGQRKGRADAQEARAESPAERGDAGTMETGRPSQQPQTKRMEAMSRSQTAANDPTRLGFKPREGECSLRAQAGRRFLYRQSVDLEGLHLSPILSQPMLEVLAAELKYEWLVAPQYGDRMSPVKAQGDTSCVHGSAATLPCSSSRVGENTLGTDEGGKGTGNDTQGADTDLRSIAFSTEALVAPGGDELEPVEHDPSEHDATNVRVVQEEQDSRVHEDGTPLPQECVVRIVHESVITDNELEEFHEDKYEAFQPVSLTDKPKPSDGNHQNPIETKIPQLDLEILQVTNAPPSLMENLKINQTNVTVQRLCDDSSTKQWNSQPESELYKHSPCESPSRELVAASEDGQTHSTHTVDVAPSVEDACRLNISEVDDVWLSCQNAVQMLEETLSWEAAGCVSSSVSCEETSALMRRTSDDSQLRGAATDVSMSASHSPNDDSPTQKGNDEDADGVEVVWSNVFGLEQANPLEVQPGVPRLVSPLENVSHQTARIVTQQVPAGADVVTEHCNSIVRTVMSEPVSSPFVRTDANESARAHGVRLEHEGLRGDGVPPGQRAPVLSCIVGGETRVHSACEAETADARGMNIIDIFTLGDKFVDYFSNLTSTASEEEQLAHNLPVCRDVELASTTSKESLAENTWADLISSIESSLAEFRDNIPPNILDIDHKPLFIQEEGDSCPQTLKAPEECVQFTLPGALNELENIGNSQSNLSDDGCKEGIWFHCRNSESTGTVVWDNHTSGPGFQNRNQRFSSSDITDNFSRMGRSYLSVSGDNLTSSPPDKLLAWSGRQGPQSPQPTELPRAGVRGDTGTKCYSQRLLEAQGSNTSRSRLAGIVGNGQASPPTRKDQTGPRRGESPSLLTRRPSSSARLRSPSESPLLTRCPSTPGLFKPVSPAQSCCIRESHSSTNRSCRCLCRSSNLHESHCPPCNADWFFKPNKETSASSVDHQSRVCRECGSCQPGSVIGRQRSLQSHPSTAGMCKCPSTPNLSCSSSSLESQFHFLSVPSRNSCSNFLHSYTLSNSETTHSCSSLDYEFLHAQDVNMSTPSTGIIRNLTPVTAPHYVNVSSCLPRDSVPPPHHTSCLPSDLLRSPSEGSLLAPFTQNFLKSYYSAIEISNNKDTDQGALPFELKFKNSTPKSLTSGTAPGGASELCLFVPDDAGALIPDTHAAAHEPYRVRSRSLGFQGLSREHCRKTKAGLPECLGGFDTPASAHFPDRLERGSYYGSHIVLQDADKVVVVDRVFPQRARSMSVSVRKMYANSLNRRDRWPPSPPRGVEATQADGQCRWRDYSELCRPPIPHRARSQSFRSQKRMPPVSRHALI